MLMEIQGQKTVSGCKNPNTQGIFVQIFWLL